MLRAFARSRRRPGSMARRMAIACIIRREAPPRLHLLSRFGMPLRVLVAELGVSVGARVCLCVCVPPSPYWRRPLYSLQLYV